MKPVDNFISDISSWKTEYSINASTIITKAEALENVTDNVYFVSGIKSWLTRRCTAKDFINKRYLFLDFDIQADLMASGYGVDTAHEWRDIILEYKDNLLDILSWWCLSDRRYCIFSWRGLHLYYVSEEPIEVGETALTPQRYRQWIMSIHETFRQEMNKFECDFTRSVFAPDSKCTDIGRLARLPWSVNQKCWLRCEIVESQYRRTEKLYGFDDVEVGNRVTSKALGVARGSCDISLPNNPETDKFRDYNSYSAMLKYIVPIIELIPLLNDEYTVKPHVSGAGASIHRPREDNPNSTRAMFISKYNELIRNNSKNEWGRLLKDYPDLQGKDKLTIVDVAMAVTGDRLRDFKSWIGKQGLSHIVESINRFDNNGKLRAEKSPDSNKKKVTGSLVPKENESACNRSKNGKFDTSGNDNKTAIIPWNIHEKTLIHTETKAWLTSLKDKVKQYQKTWGRFQKEIRESCKGLRLYPISNEMINYRFSKAKDIDRYIQTTVAVLEGILTREIEVSHTDITEMTIFNLVKEKYEKKI